MRRALYIVPCPIFGKCCTALRTDRAAGAPRLHLLGPCLENKGLYSLRLSSSPAARPLPPRFTSHPARRPRRPV